MSLPWRGSILSGALILATALPAGAQSAADKATARGAAREGIQLYQEGRYAESLDRMQRAQALYDAPVHLLYIARAQEKLGQLVEAAETYRTLSRVELAPGAPQPFVAAVQDGRTELQSLEPRIPTLLIRVEPEELSELELQIDGRAVAAAVVGIARPINPGRHVVSASAAGHAPAELEVEVPESGKEEVVLRLEPHNGDGPPPAQEVGRDGPGEAAGGQGGARRVAFLVGARFGLAVPGGAFGEHTVAGSTVDPAVGDRFGPGVGLELHGGLHFGKYFTPKLLLALHGLGSGPELDEVGAALPAGQSMTHRMSAYSAGIGLMVGTPRGQLGGFGEIDLLPVHQFSSRHTVDASGCEIDASAPGGALRLAGGAVIPVKSFIHLTPFAAATFGRFSRIRVERSGACPAALGGPLTELDEEIDNGSVHSLILLGVGGDFLFGGGE